MKRNNFVGKMLSLLLIFSLVVGMIPTMAFATEQEMVYISVSFDEKYIEDKDGNPIAYVGIPFDTVASIDLEEYGLGDYLYDADGDGSYETTALQLIIYAHENIYGGSWSEVDFTGGAGSSYFQGGIFGFDENLNYFLNGEYPLESEGWGATSDHIVLQPGDFIDMGSFSSWDFYQDSNYGFHIFLDENDEITHNYTVEAGADLTVKLARSYSGMGSGATVYDEASYPIYYGTSYGNETGSETTDDSGNTTITFGEAGTYYVWADGGYGAEFPDSIVNTPAYAIVTVTEAETQADPAVTEVIEKIGAIDQEVTLASEAKIIEARSAYDALTDAQKTLVTNVDTLTIAEGKLATLKADKAAADAVIAKIDAIGDVTLESASVIATARSAYDALTDSQQALVTNYTTLTDAEIQLEELVKAADEAQKNKAAADTVIGKINAIGNVTLSSENVIEGAREAYDALTDAQKTLVTNVDTLTAAEGKLATLKVDKATADTVIGMINAIGNVTLSSENVIEDARKAYDALTDAQKAFVNNLVTLEKAEIQLKNLQEQKTAADKKAAADVDALIGEIGTVSIYNVSKVTKARTAYDSLTTAQQPYVTKLETLTKAEKTLNKVYEDASKINHKEIYNQTAKYLQSLGTPMVNSIGGEWMVIDLVRAGFDCPKGYYENVEEYVKAKINDKEQLHRSKGTDNSRVILALTAAGYDVTDIAGHNLLMGLTDMDYVRKQGINGPIWALIAFDSHGYEIPTNKEASKQVTREVLIDYILDNRVDDGGWNLMLASKVCDPDMTGMAIQALAPYYDTNPEVKIAVDGALETLSKVQHENGGYSSMEGSCSESCAQVIVALTSLGINPETDSRFTKNGVSVVDAMCLFATEGGGFTHVPNGALNGMATEQGQYALAAYYRFLNGETSLYDMSDVQIRKVEKLPAVDTTKPVDKVEVGTTEDSKDVLEETSKEIINSLTNEIETVVSVDEVVVDAIKNAVKEGKKVVTSITVIVEPTDKEDAEKTFGKEDVGLVKKAAGDNPIAQYFDLSVLMSVYADGEEVAKGKVSVLKDPITFEIAIPEELKQVEEGMTRIYYIIKVHNGEVETIIPTVRNGILSFTTDEFSTYALAYEDVAEKDEISADTGNNDAGNNDAGNNAGGNNVGQSNNAEAGKAPKTGDTNYVFSWIVLMTLAMASMVAIRRKEN